MQLTERDLSLLRGLSELGVLTTSQIGRLYFPDVRPTTMLRRLRLLHRGAVVYRRKALTRNEYVWSLTTKGANRLGLDLIPFTPRNVLDHDVLLTEVRLSLSKVGLGAKWTSEAAIKRKTFRFDRSTNAERDVIPDALFVVKIGERFEPVALELELTPKKKERYRKLFRTYGQKNSIWLVWYLVKSERMGELIADAWKAARPYNDDNPYLAWSLIDDVLNRPLECTVRSLRKAFLLPDLFELGGAQSGAHPVSTQGGKSTSAPAGQGPVS